ncbi:MAG: 4Fe-4S dicluster domain-containing protein [Desulfobacterota bacterium]|nr:4Fe-4S dicluster domain-containing protein [Thermodesulfobacteriota bacterium]
MRRIVQCAVLAFIGFLFFAAAYGVRLPADILLRADPLIALAASVASRSLHQPLVISLIVFLAALLGGRIFCGWICPLGTLFDFLPRRHRHIASATSNIKYGLLLCIALCSLAGINAAGLVDPLTILTRISAFVIRPITDAAGNTALDAVRPLAERLRLFSLSRTIIPQFLYNAAGLSALVVLGLCLLNLYAHRFWCRSLCPLGALLGVVSLVAPLRRRVGNACTHCMACRRICPVDAINEDPTRCRLAECIVCGTCSSVCPEAAISFTRRSKVLSFRQGIVIGRRTLITSLAAGIAWSVAVRATPVGRLAGKGLLRPPGSVSEDMFLSRCIRCGQCMAVCPTNTLQPCLFEAGLEGIWSPRLMPRLAGCDQTCSRCGEVCPTGAIRALSLDEKKHAKIGTAFIDTNRCLVWAQHRLCFICDEQCPYNAIVFKWHDGERKPFVIDIRCNGCGLCEQQCPVQGTSAIIVSPHGALRLSSGSYRSEAQRLLLELREDPGLDRFLPEAGDHAPITQ